MEPVQSVVEQIAKRYAHPGRAAYLYLFQMKPDSDLTHLVPDVESVLAAWMDEGQGLTPTDIETAVDHCTATYNLKLKTIRTRISEERRRQMARSVVFTVVQSGEDMVKVTLVSRALAFSPKGDRTAHEEWKPTEDGGWYSAYRPDRD
jgi:hypothetical protein